ncbi:hypothetical protein LCGC14_0957860 [marine sediment metagenome]|uniref:Uncharacterized protein n=1 Tax=marine sediment metagenome TaxID=412755 RepID=A0A0F9RLV1_9ZZZZ
MKYTSLIKASIDSISFLLLNLTMIIWEIIENTLLLEVGIKPRPDSPQNIISDLIFGVFGAGSQLILFNIYYEEKKKVKTYYGFGIAGLILFILIYIFGAIISA